MSYCHDCLLPSQAFTSLILFICHLFNLFTCSCSPWNFISYCSMTIKIHASNKQIIPSMVDTNYINVSVVPQHMSYLFCSPSVLWQMHNWLAISHRNLNEFIFEGALVGVHDKNNPDIYFFGLKQFWTLASIISK